MNSEPTTPATGRDTALTEETQTTAIVEVSPETHALVDKEMLTADEKIKNETKALVEAIKRRAQAEVKGAGELTLDAYLSAVRSAREAIEQNKLFDPDRVEYSIWLIQKEAEKNWQSIVDQVATLGDRLADAAKAAWDALTAPRLHRNEPPHS
jgi:hypothetical protein